MQSDSIEIPLNAYIPDKIISNLNVVTWLKHADSRRVESLERVDRLREESLRVDKEVVQTRPFF